MHPTPWGQVLGSVKYWSKAQLKSVGNQQDPQRDHLELLSVGFIALGREISSYQLPWK